VGGDHFVAGADDLVADRDAVGFDLAGGDEGGPGAEGELVDSVMIGGHDNHRPAFVSCLEPRLVNSFNDGATITGAYPTPVLVLRQNGWISPPQPSGGLDFPWVCEAPDGGKFRAFGVCHEQSEQSPGFHGAELVVVADQHQFGFGAMNQEDELGEVAGGDHRRFVAHHDLAFLYCGLASANLPEKLG
jgi:hypothetical protein